MDIYRVIDLRSDTLTKPSMEMRKAMFEAEVGDDVFKEDPTVNELEAYVAHLLEKQNAIFVSSGTMANLIAVMSHCWQRGAEILLGDKSHIHINEQGGIASIANVHSRTLVNRPDGTFNIDELKEKIRIINDQHFPTSTLICLENTHNICNGSALPIDFIDGVCSIAKSYDMKIHLDGARLFNASIKTGEPVERIVRNCDSVSICLSKGLGCPVGTVLAGSHEFIERAIRCRKVLGGGMRQSGVLAAAGLWALKQNVDRLIEDHRHTDMIIKAIDERAKSFLKVDPKSIQTNIGYIEVDPNWMSAPDLATRLSFVSVEEKNLLRDRCAIVKMGPKSETRLRFVSHADITTDDILQVIEKINFIIDNETNNS